MLPIKFLLLCMWGIRASPSITDPSSFKGVSKLKNVCALPVYVRVLTYAHSIWYVCIQVREWAEYHWRGATSGQPVVPAQAQGRNIRHMLRWLEQWAYKCKSFRLRDRQSAAQLDKWSHAPSKKQWGAWKQTNSREKCTGTSKFLLPVRVLVCAH